MLADEKGGMATVMIPDVIQSNGVIQVINRVLLPNSRHRDAAYAVLPDPESGVWAQQNCSHPVLTSLKK